MTEIIFEDDNIDHLDHFYQYDPDTGYKVGEYHVLPESVDPTEPYTTTTPPPQYDPDIEQVKYDSSADQWNIESLTTPLGSFKDNAKSVIDAEVKSVVRRYATIAMVTTGIYAQKYAEATRYISAGSPADLTLYPYLQVDVTIGPATTAIDAAATVIAKNDELIAVTAAMELIRLQAKQDIDAVTVDTTVDAARDRIKQISDAAAESLYQL